VNHGKQGPRRILFECNEDINIALRPEVVADDAAEKGELRDLPLAAEVAEFFLVVIDGDAA